MRSAPPEPGPVRPETPASEEGPREVAGTAHREIAPRWFELLALTGAVSLGTVGSVGLLLAVTGHYRSVVALGLGLPLAGTALLVLHRGLPPGGTSQAAHRSAAAALVLAVAYAGVAGVTPSQNVVQERDPGSYVSTARWLAREGTLEIDGRGEAFDGIRGLRFSGAAVYDVGGPYPPADVPGGPTEVRESGRLETQFNHLTAVALAAGYDVGGHRLMFRMPALFAGVTLLVLYAVAVRLTGRPYVALLAPALLAASLPFLFVSRNTYSESFAPSLLWAVILVLAGVHLRPRPGVGAIGGLLLGGLVCTRVDALLYVVLLLPLVAVSLGVPAAPGVRAARTRTWGAALAATTVVGAIGWYDLSARSGFYGRDLGPQVSLLRGALIGSALASAAALAAWISSDALRRAGRRAQHPAAVVGAVLVAGALLFGWLVRPHVETAETTTALTKVVVLQRAAGLPEEPLRSYAEDSLRWMAWYLGTPALLAAVGGMAWATHRALRARLDATGTAVLALGLGAGALYWYDPNITPDQLWASRRFIPATFPSLALWATAAVAAVASGRRAQRLRLARPAVGTLAIGVAAAVLLVGPALTTWPLRWHRSQPGHLVPIEETCATVGPDAAIIVLGGFGAATLPQSLRSWCGVPVAAQGSAVSPTLLPALARRLDERGYRLHLVAPDLRDVVAYQLPGGPEVVSTTAVSQRWLAEQTLVRPPEDYVDPDLALEGAPTPFALHSLEVVVDRGSSG